MSATRLLEWAVLAACATASPTLRAQDEESRLFRVDEAGDRTVVSANRTGVPADQALRELAGALGWRVHFETERLRGRMSTYGVDVAFTEQNPRTIAHLLSVAGGADVVFSDRSEDGRQLTTLMVVSPPSNETESGRQRLREWSARWYRTFLQDELRAEPLVETFGMDARMNLGRILMEQGALEDAALVYAEVKTEDPSHGYVPTALLKLAECRFELGEEHWAEAETAARELTRRHPSLPEAAAGTVLLGKILLARGRDEECVKTLTASYLRLAGTPEILPLYLLVGRAEYRLGRPRDVLRTMNVLDGAHDYHELQRADWLDYLFLRGYALHSMGEHDAAMEPLEVFLGTADEDARRGTAFIMLGRSYLELGRIVEARAAAIEAHHFKVGGKLEADWARAASKFYAKTALEIGDKAEAFDKLEVEVRKSPESEPDLVVYLIEAFMDEGRYQKAMITAELIAHLEGPEGDRARFLRIKAMWKQSVAAGGSTLRTFPSRALPLVESVKDTDDMRRIAELFGKAYEQTGQVEKAADADPRLAAMKARDMMLVAWIVGAASCQDANAQRPNGPGPKPEQIEEQLERAQRALAESESRLQRLQELRIRLAMGLPVEAERYFRLGDAEREIASEGGSERLVTEEAEVERLSLQATALSEQLDASRSVKSRRARAGSPESSELAGDVPSVTRRIDVPRINAPRIDAPRIVPRPGAADVPFGLSDRTSGSEPPKPAGGGLPLVGMGDPRGGVEAPSPDELQSEPVEPSYLIVGTDDHAAVGRVLLRAGDALLRRASAATAATRAVDLRAEALERFAQAKRELEPLVSRDPPALVDLYYLARCEEKLGNSAAADSLYAQIISIDVENGPDGEIFGRWARAAQAAKSVLRWIDDRGGWKPSRDIESIRWE